VSEKVFWPDEPASTEQQGRAIKFNTVDPDYFRLMGVRLLRGRGFTERDDKSGPKVMLVNETMAKDYWPSEDPIGRYVRIGNPTNEPMQIVGVVFSRSSNNGGYWQMKFVLELWMDYPD
jgi:hypothetical protein